MRATDKWLLGLYLILKEYINSKSISILKYLKTKIYDFLPPKIVYVIFGTTH